MQFPSSLEEPSTAGEAERYAPVSDPILWAPKLQIHATITLTQLTLQGNPFSPTSTQSFIYSFMIQVIMEHLLCGYSSDFYGAYTK